MAFQSPFPPVDCAMQTTSLPAHFETCLTRKQQKMLHEIELYKREKGINPSYRDLMTRLGYKSLGAVHRLIRELQKKGHIQKPHLRSWRSVEVAKLYSQNRSKVESHSSFTTVKAAAYSTSSLLLSESALPPYIEQTDMIEVIGTVTGSTPPELFRNPQKIYCNYSHIKKNKLQALVYALIIQDTSFTNEHLLPGDIIIVEPADDIVPGELVLATTHNESIIGHFFDEGEVVRFRSSAYAHHTSFFQAKKVSSQTTQIWGIIIGMLRGWVI